MSPTNGRLARLVRDVARAAGVETVLCDTRDGQLPCALRDLDPGLRVVAATSDGSTVEELENQGFEVLRLPVLGSDKYRQARHVVSMAVRTGHVATGELVACAISHRATGDPSDLVLVTEVEAASAEVALSEIAHLADGVRSGVVRAAMRAACHIARIAVRKDTGAILVLGDSEKVLDGSRPLIPNPFEHTPESSRKLGSPEAEDVLVELAKLDGAFVVRGDGLIRTAGTLLAASGADVELPQGLGSRHAAAAGVTARTAATALVVSATDGRIRVFKDGRMVMKTDADVLLPFLE
ncbi:MAG: diadenylate cyclase [Gemmatimonadota bacterium]|jgi:DNA integrity scanning protein DisA with diadenylate cyclase activity